MANWFPGQSLTASNAPNIVILTPATMTALTNDPDTVATYYHGNVAFSALFWGNSANSNAMWAGSYIHETGNLLSISTYGNATELQNFLSPGQSFPWDPDSGVGL